MRRVSIAPPGAWCRDHGTGPVNLRTGAVGWGKDRRRRAAPHLTILERTIRHCREVTEGGTRPPTSRVPCPSLPHPRFRCRRTGVETLASSWCGGCLWATFCFIAFHLSSFVLIGSHPSSSLFIHSHSVSHQFISGRDARAGGGLDVYSRRLRQRAARPPPHLRSCETHPWKVKSSHRPRCGDGPMNRGPLPQPTFFELR